MNSLKVDLCNTTLPILTVEKKAFDILLEQIPWSFRTVKLPWNKYIIHVEW